MSDNTQDKTHAAAELQAGLLGKHAEVLDAGLGRKIAAVPVVLDGRELYVRADGAVLQKISGLLNGYVEVPAWDEARKKIAERMKEEVEVVTPWIATGLLPPVEMVNRAAAEILCMKLDTEVWVVFLARDAEEKDGKKGMKWSVVVPEQEVTGASADIDKFAEQLQPWLAAGCRVMGSMHLHPGNGHSCSSIDEKFFAEWSGTHIVLGRQGGMTWYASALKKYWVVQDTELGGGEKVWAKTEKVLRAIRKGAKIDELVKKKVYTVVTTGYGYGRQTELYADEYGWEGGWGRWREEMGHEGKWMYDSDVKEMVPSHLKGKFKCTPDEYKRFQNCGTFKKGHPFTIWDERLQKWVTEYEVKWLRDWRMAHLKDGEWESKPKFAEPKEKKEGKKGGKKGRVDAYMFDWVDKDMRKLQNLMQRAGIRGDYVDTLFNLLAETVTEEQEEEKSDARRMTLLLLCVRKAAVMMREMGDALPPDCADGMDGLADDLEDELMGEDDEEDTAEVAVVQIGSGEKVEKAQKQDDKKEKKA